MAQSKQSRQLQDEKYMLETDSQDIASTLDLVGFPPEYRDDITGILVEVLDGDFGEIWFTESPAPYDLYAQYHDLAYYTEE